METPSTVPEPETSTHQTTSRSISTAAGWMLGGLISAGGGAAITVWLTVKALGDDPGWAGLWLYLAVPIGLMIGLGFAVLVARTAEAASPGTEDMFTRQELTAAGVALLIALALAIGWVFSQL